ncbi:conserved hypothetical protein [Coccidioides posadasii str. Silveira]|uniref:Uncharacterized protein n=1 Tax=Coccidioides posadasii (strain RMSCC 757 / Silveira) TaxID=443226 RepID=E9DH37_COCPS|nr:conserved hypothetical protein [Coccidioides posadasii str. Silveira]
MAGQSNLPSLAPATKNQGLVITRDSRVNLDGHFFNNLIAAMEYINNQALHYLYGLQVKLMNTLISRAWQHVMHTNFEVNFHNA